MGQNKQRELWKDFIQQHGRENMKVCAGVQIEKERQAGRDGDALVLCFRNLIASGRQ